MKKHIFHQLKHFFRPFSRLFFVHFRNTVNTGDMNCTPYLYFKDFFDQYPVLFCDLQDVDKTDIKKNDFVILGGGGLLDHNQYWNSKINKLLRKTPNVIGWGLGFNTHYRDTQKKEKILFNKFRLITCRDWQHPAGLPFLPCVSCMIPLLDRQYTIKRKIGIVEHYDFPIGLDFERTNNKAPLENILDMIGSSEIIITNGYHAMYWATLMGKKVILYNPFSCRYDYFKWPPIRYSGNLEADIKNSQAYPQSKEEFRQLTLDFFEKVKKILMQEMQG